MPQGTRQLTAEERQRIRTLYFDAHLSRAKINEVTGYTLYQIRYAIRADSAIVKPRSGRPKVMTAEQEQELIDFVCASKENRRMGFLQLSMNLFDGAFGPSMLKRCLYRHGFQRRIARRKPPISEKN
jgi:transposase